MIVLTAAALLAVLSGIANAEGNGRGLNHPNMMGNHGQEMMESWREGMTDPRSWHGKRDEHDRQWGEMRGEHDCQWGEKRGEHDRRWSEKRDEHDCQWGEKRGEHDCQWGEKRGEHDRRWSEKRDEHDCQWGEKRGEHDRPCHEKHHEQRSKYEVCHHDHSPFFVVPHVPHGYAMESCQKHGGVLADIDDANFLEAFAAAFKCDGPFSESWVNSWNGDHYRGACLIMSTGAMSGGGAINTPRDCCTPRHALCKKMHCEKKRHMPCDQHEKKHDCNKHRKDHAHRRSGERDDWPIEISGRDDWPVEVGLSRLEAKLPGAANAR